MPGNMEEEGCADQRHRMVEAIRVMAYEVDPNAPISQRVMRVMDTVPRHLFVPRDECYAAYYNHPLPIGHGQTISQPYIVALMSDLLELDKQKNVLEVGAGSGYQTAVLAQLAGRVFSLEIIASLAARAAVLLGELGYANVMVKVGDGNCGWPEHAPYHAIIVTAAAQCVPQSLLDQLAPGGRMVIPVGDLAGQDLILIVKGFDGTIHRKKVLPVRFVPLTGKNREGDDAGCAKTAFASGQDCDESANDALDQLRAGRVRSAAVLVTD